MENQMAPEDLFDRIMLLPGLRIFYSLYRKKKSLLLYLFFGVLTTAVSIGSFLAADLIMDTLLANIVSWICAVTFAYATNRVWVFGSQAHGQQIFREALSFYSGRLLTLGMEEAMLLIFVTWLHFNSLVIKILAQFVVLVLNYVISKWLVFRAKQS